MYTHGCPSHISNERQIDLNSKRFVPNLSRAITEMMKSYIWLQTSDGSIEQVEQDVALFSPFIYHNMDAGMGSSKIRPIVLPSLVTPIILGLILDFCRFQHVPGRSNLERKFFNEKFFRMETERLRELTSAAYSLQMTPLVDLCCDALAKLLEGKSIEEIRQTLDLPDDVIEEESWKPMKIASNDPQVRLWNKLHAKKMKEKEKMAAGHWLQNVKHEAPHADDRSIAELLSFINGEDEDPQDAKPSRNKKKYRKRKNKQKDASSVCNISDSSGQSSNATLGNDYILDTPGFDVCMHLLDHMHGFLIECLKIMMVVSRNEYRLFDIECGTLKALAFGITTSIMRLVFDVYMHFLDHLHGFLIVFEDASPFRCGGLCSEVEFRLAEESARVSIFKQERWSSLYPVTGAKLQVGLSWRVNLMRFNIWK
ncbi:hypothetical protein L6452_33219 [Arctium lappa]|uniref:Uncharacterized protein n=1 Tax=Arctium lappa TaxID=4217 RepID=A0ACB8Z7Z6_ARCLA|nr:hypothetical protein L6452_33219 [Arctium lappa]